MTHTADTAEADDHPRTNTAADALGRCAVSTTARGGRGAVVGWTRCPLCGDGNNRVFAVGRGLAVHLHAVHTPWAPPTSRKALKRRRRRLATAAARIPKQEGRDTVPVVPHDDVSEESPPPRGWDPTPAERRAWETRVLELVKRTEEESRNTNNHPTPTTRDGRTATPYRASIPPFIRAAANGRSAALRRMLLSHDDDDTTTAAAAARRLTLLQTRDRHGSTAEHWAAGEGHLDCLRYLVRERRRLQQRQRQRVHDESNASVSDNTPSTDTAPTKKVRRRDGKTPLHYAARNGRLECIRFLLEEQPQQQQIDVDVASGDGTTPLHMACYGGQYEAVQRLGERNGANVHAANAWGCTAAHFVSMCKTANDDDDDLAQRLQKLCDWLAGRGVAFDAAQSQGHSALHKAAQHGNGPVLEWLARHLTAAQKRRAARPDRGGHRPWDICRAVGGKAALVSWIRREFGRQDDDDGHNDASHSDDNEKADKDKKTDEGGAEADKDAGRKQSQ